MSGANGYFAAGPNRWMWVSQAFGGALSLGFLGLGSGPVVSFGIPGRPVGRNGAATTQSLRLLKLDIGGFGEFAPLGQFAANQRCEFLRRAADRVDPIANE